MRISSTSSTGVDDVVLVAGARPNFMKLAPLLRELARHRVRATLIHTGQHYGHDMSDVFFEQLRMPTPDVHLDIGSASHGVQAGQIMVAFDEYLAARRAPPQGVVVVGDVNSTMACALVAVKRGIPVAHVEAGLRSFDRAMPEEINRIVTDSISDLLLVSEPAGLDNLDREGVPADRVRYCGNVMIDSLVEQLPSARALDMPAKLGLRRGEYAVATLHRPSNVDVPQRLRELIAFLLRVGGEHPVVFPVHPRTEKMLAELGVREELVHDARARLVPPSVTTSSARGPYALRSCAARSNVPKRSMVGMATPHYASSMRSSRAGASRLRMETQSRLSPRHWQLFSDRTASLGFIHSRRRIL